VARLRFRDRFWSPPVARAVTSPASILIGGLAAAVAIVATAPLSIPALAVAAVGAVAGGAAYGGRVLLAVPRNKRGPRMDPFAVQEPWRRFVSEALAARRRFDDAVRKTARGPLRDRMESIGGGLDDALEQIWAIAHQGHALQSARANVNVEPLRRELADIEGRSPAAGSPLERTASSLRAQIASADRMDAVIAETVDKLRLLDARLDEAVTSAIELSAGMGSAQSAGDVGGTVDSIVTEMEALRLALDEATDAGSAEGLGTTESPGAQGTPGTPGMPAPGSGASATQPPGPS
jgi:hypothetical protein